MQDNTISSPRAFVPPGRLPLEQTPMLDPSDGDYLQRLGIRVREARARRGMTRRILSRDSGVSERYLAQLEAGRGNISVLLLRQVAKALDLPIDGFLHDGAERSEELVHTAELLHHLSPEKLHAAREVLLRQFSAADPAWRRQRIAIIGLRGAGKSTLGGLLAEHLNVTFIELDRVIEQHSGLGLSVIFDLYGQNGFRRLERECLDEVLQRHASFVLATGGSLVSEAATFGRLLTDCFTIWLRATPEEHMQRVIAQGDTRPMSDNREAMAELRSILVGREPLYRRADAIVDTSLKTVPAALESLISAVPAMAPQT
jgi:XRE family aerobic/anaerobic benzoate catabolism transcriptional regulator